jgi:hypothetical protein
MIPPLPPAKGGGIFKISILPGSCGKDNMCLKNTTGPACGVCPDGYAFTSAGCEYLMSADRRP